jgi:hypothetical protein
MVTATAEGVAGSAADRELDGAWEGAGSAPGVVHPLASRRIRVAVLITHMNVILGV